MNNTMTLDQHTTAPAAPPSWYRGDDEAQAARVRSVISARSFAVLSTVSEAGFPHAAGVLYSAVGTTLYVNTMRSSRKARNVTTTGRVGVVIPFRKLPVGPPFNVQFQADATVLDRDDPEIISLVRQGELSGITGHGELDEPDGCFLRLTPRGRVHSYGVGVSTWALARDPLHVGARSVRL